MQTITIEVNNSIYDHIMFFLKNLPNHLINIHFDNKEQTINYISKNRSLRGVFQHYADPNKQALEKSAWRNHILQKYQKDTDD